MNPRSHRDLGWSDHGGGEPENLGFGGIKSIPGGRAEFQSAGPGDAGDLVVIQIEDVACIDLADMVQELETWVLAFVEMRFVERGNRLRLYERSL